jgi:cytoskeletal protein CcmA (bactofilin family)
MPLRSLRLFLFMLLMLIPASIAAAEAQQGEQCTIGADTTVQGNLYSLCQNLVIDGAVRGDVVALAGSVAINGSVDGDVTAMAGQVTVTGIVGGDVRALAIRLAIMPGPHLFAVHGDVAGAGLSADVAAPVAGDMLYAGYQAIIGSAVGGDVRFLGAVLAVDEHGQVGGSAEVRIIGSIPRPPDSLAGVSLLAPGLSLGQDAHVRGDLKYEAPEQARIGPGTVGGQVRFVQGATSGLIGAAPFADVMANYLGRILRDLLSLMAIGLVALLVAQGGLLDVTRQLKTRAILSFGFGLAAMVLAFPAMALLLLVSAVLLGFVHILTLGELTLAVAIGLAIVNLILIGGFWFVALFLGRLAVCYLIGQWIARHIMLVADRATTLVISLLLGVIAFAAIADLPVDGYGLLANMAAACFGLGAILLALRNVLLRPQLRVAPAVSTSPISALLPGMTEGYPPLPEDIESLPGMDNLPEGFTWFDS